MIKGRFVVLKRFTGRYVFAPPALLHAWVIITKEQSVCARLRWALRSRPAAGTDEMLDMHTSLKKGLMNAPRPKCATHARTQRTHMPPY